MSPSGTGAKHYSPNKRQLQTGVSAAQAGKVTFCGEREQLLRQGNRYMAEHTRGCFMKRTDSI